MSKQVILIGLHPDSVNIEKWPELTPAKLRASFEETLTTLSQAGFEARWCLTDTGDTAAIQVESALSRGQPDVVVIGAGIRTDVDHFALFERILNAVHALAPKAKIAFNTDPFDTVEAVQRWATQ